MRTIPAAHTPGPERSPAAQFSHNTNRRDETVVASEAEVGVAASDGRGVSRRALSPAAAGGKPQFCSEWRS